MKIGIIADIHANLAAFTATLEDLAAQNVQEIISLGDNIGYGPDPEQVVDALLDHNVLSVLGNHEYALQSDRYLQKLNPSPRKSLLLNRDLLSEENLVHCVNLPQVLLRHEARFVHGCPPKSPSAYLYRPSDHKLEKLYTGFKEQICFYGHTHAFGHYDYDGTTYQTQTAGIGECTLNDQWRHINNVGSVGQPRDGKNNQAKYGLWDTETNKLEIRSLAYDIETTVSLLKELGFHGTNASRLL